MDPPTTKYVGPTACLFSDVPNEMSSSWNPYLGCFISLTTYQRDNILVIRTAPELTGPWSEPEVVFRPERTSDDSTVYRPHLIEITFA